MLLGLIARKDPRTLQRKLITFSPQEVLAGRTNVALANDDIVRVFDQAEADMISNAVGLFNKRVAYLDAVSAATGDPAQTAAGSATAAQNSAVAAAI